MSTLSGYLDSPFRRLDNLNVQNNCNICDLAYEKGPYVLSSFALLSVADPTCSSSCSEQYIDCKRHYTPHQDSFFIFRCYTGSTETFINVISNTTVSAILLITVSANSLRQFTNLGIKNQQLTHVTTIILHAETTLRVLEVPSVPPNGEMRTNLPQT